MTLGVVTLTGSTFPSAWAAYGIIKFGDNYYSVASYDSTTQITLDDLTADADALTTYELARPEIPLAATFESVANDSNLTYYPDQNELYPAVRQRGDQAIRTREQDDPYFDRPIFYSVRTVEFDPLVGSRKRLAFYPTPDAAYVLRVPMILRATMIDETNLYPAVPIGYVPHESEQSASTERISKQRRIPMAWNKLDKFGMLSLTDATEITLDLVPRFAYKFIHTGVDSAGNNDANSAKSAWLSTLSATITADNTVEDEKLFIADGGNETIGPGIDKLYVVSTAGADAAIKIVRQVAHSDW